MPTKFEISGHHIEVTPALEGYVRKRLTKAEQMFDKITHIHVILTVEKLSQKAEAEIRLAGNQNSIFASATSDDLYKSIDKLEDKILTQVKKHHDKLKDHD